MKNLNKKAIGVILAAIVAAISGGAEVISLSERVDALEEIHPEIVTGVPLPAEEEVTEEEL